MFPAACFPKSNTRGGAPTFVGPLDTLMAQGAVLRHASSVRRLLASYTGSAIKLRGNGIGTLADIAYLADGSLDLSAAAALAAADGGTLALWHTAYDQAGIVDAVQTTDANQMEFGIAYQDRGEMGGAGASARWLDLNLGTITQPTFFSIVGNMGALSLVRILIGTGATGGNRYVQMSSATPRQNWGVLQTGAAIGAAGKHLFGFLSNDATSSIYIDGALNATGDADNTQLDMSGGRIGSTVSATTNWTVTAGNTISEVIIFDGDPTGLAGWADFVAAQKAYFGIA
jgi:hypothetical protein